MRNILAVGLVAAVGFLTVYLNSLADNKSQLSTDGSATPVEAQVDNGDERVNLDFTVCEEGRLPEELVEIIEEKKAEPFKLTFTTREYMYIVVGYGAQQRGGCSVTVNELYRTSQAVYIDTNLVGG